MVANCANRDLTLAIECPANMLLREMPLLAAFAMIPLAVVPARSQAVFTPAQASDGLAAYQVNCASCHLPDLAGRNEAPQLAGGNFINAWRSRSTAELIRLMQATMPPSNAGGLSDEVYTNIAAFLLRANGAPAGDRPLTASTPGRSAPSRMDRCRPMCAIVSLVPRMRTRSAGRARLRPKASRWPARSRITVRSRTTRCAIPTRRTG